MTPPAAGDLPDIVREALGRRAATERPEEGLRLKTRVPFIRPDDDSSTAPAYVVRTSGMVWLVAATDGASWAVGSGRPDEVVYADGLWGGTLEVAGWRMRVPAGRRDDIAGLVERFGHSAGGAGFEDPVDPRRAPALAGGWGFVPEWSDRVPAPDDGPWILAYATGRRPSLLRRDGSLEAVTLYLGFTLRAVVVAALGRDRLFSQTLQGPAEVTSRVGRTALSVGDWRFERLFSADAVERVAELVNAEPGPRLALSARWAVEQGAHPAVMPLLRLAIDRGYAGDIASVVAQLAFYAGHYDGALEWRVRARMAPRPGEIGAWVRNRASYRRAARSVGPELIAFLTTHRASAGRAKPPAQYPWPPDSEAAFLAAAAAVGNEWSHARGMLPTAARGSADELARRAVLAEGDGDPAAAAAWRAAGEALAAEARYPEASAAFGRAAAGEETALDRFMEGRFAHRAGRTADGHAAWARAVTLDAELAFLAAAAADADELTAFARWAEEAGRVRVAAEALHRALRAKGADRETMKRHAERLSAELDAPDLAADLLEDIAEDRDAHAEQAEPDAGLWLKAARLRLAAGQPEQAAEDARRAVEDGFLSPAIYAGALSLAGLPLDEKTRGWWAHVQSVLTAGDTISPPSLVDRPLSVDDLNGFHPGGGSWLERVQTSIDSAKPPDRAALVRGLERVRAEHHPELDAVVARTSDRFGLGAVEAFIFRGDEAFGLCAWPLKPPVLLVGQAHLEPGPRFLAGPALHFAVAVELAHLACQHPLPTYDPSAVGTSRSLYQTLGRFAGTAETVVDLVTLVPGIDQIAKLQRILAISRRVFSVRGAVDKAIGLSDPLSRWLRGPEADGATGVRRAGLEGAALRFRIHADRVALAVVGDLAAAVEAVLKTSDGPLERLREAQADGLAALLARAEGATLSPDEALRLSDLVGFAARQLRREREVSTMS